MDITNRLAGKVALVTGGSRGIGAEIVRRLAAEGADIGFTYHTGKDEAEQVAGQVRGLGRRAFVIARGPLPHLPNGAQRGGAVGRDGGAGRWSGTAGRGSGAAGRQRAPGRHVVFEG